jgi:hypothetical protein
MTRDDIIRMAREAGVLSGYESELLQRFATLVAEAEREACAALARKTICDTHTPTGINIYGSRAARAIRARGNK